MIRLTPLGRLGLWLVACLLAALTAGPGNAAEVRLRILETTDLHMNLLNYDYYQDKPTDEYGLAKTITLIKAARAEVKNSLLFDNGDLLQGSPLGDFVANGPPLQPGQVHPAYKVLNALGMDAANIGNHEFNYGLPFLRQAIAGAAFPYVSANVHIDDGDGNPDNDLHAFTPYVILERSVSDAAGAQHRLKIGVIGFVPPQILVWDRLRLDGKLTVRDIQETARRRVPEMRAQGADIVVAALIGPEHAATLRWVRGEVARTSAPITSCFAQVAADPSVLLINNAQLHCARRALQATEFEGLPLLSAASPFKSGGAGAGPTTPTSRPVRCRSGTLPTCTATPTPSSRCVPVAPRCARSWRCRPANSTASTRQVRPSRT